MRDTFELLLAQAEQGVESVHDTMTEPDDDWQPIMLLANDERAVVLGIDGTFFETQESKDTLADIVLVSAIAEFEAKAVSFISSAWFTTRPNLGGPAPTSLPEEEAPAQQPDRREAVVIYTASLDRWTDSIAEIHRHPDKPPTLSEWNDIQQANADVGRFPRAINEGLQAVVARTN